MTRVQARELRSRRNAKLRRLAAATVALNLVVGVAWGYWFADSAAGGNGAAAVTTVNQGATPTANAAGQAVTVSWAARTLSNGQAVDGYIVKRYSGATPQTVLSGCSGTITATSCIENSVPPGTWTYSVTPVFATNWQGAESVKSGTVTISDRPVVTTTVANLAFTENGAAVALDSGITVTDSDGSDVTGATVSMTTNYVNGQDTLNFVNQNGITGSWNAGSGVLTLSGTTTLANYQTAMRSITYSNTADDLTSGNRNVNFVASDSGGASNTATRQVAVTAVNDAPVINKPAGQSTAKNTAKVFSTGNGNLISISDVDAAPGSMQVQLVSTNGATTLSTTSGLTFSVGDGTADATMTFTGSIAAVNTALAGLSFNPTNNFTGAASLQIVTSDQGNTGSGGALTDDDSVAITVLSYFDTISADSSLINYYRLGEASAVGATTTVTSDTFNTGAAGALITARSPEVGSWFHAAGGTTEILSNAGRARRNGSNYSIDYMTPAPSSPDYSVSADLYAASLLTGDRVALIARANTAGTTFYMARYEKANNAWIIVKYAAGGTTTLGASFPQTLVQGTTFNAKLTVSGSSTTTLSLYIDGGLAITTTDSTTPYTATGFGGIMDGSSSGGSVKTNAAGLHVDNFKVTEVSTPVATDSKGTNHGTYLNAPTAGLTGAISADSNTAVQFDGVDDYVTVARQISADFSVEFWFKSTQGIGVDPRWSQGAGLVDNNITGTDDDFGVSLRSDGVVTAGVGGGTDTSISSAAGFDDGAWHHVVMTRVQSTGVFKLYVDGALQASGTNNVNLLNAQANITFGRLASGANYYLGNLDEIAMYNTELSAAAVLAHYNAR